MLLQLGFVIPIVCTGNFGVQLNQISFDNSMKFGCFGIC